MKNGLTIYYYRVRRRKRPREFVPVRIDQMECRWYWLARIVWHKGKMNDRYTGEQRWREV